MTYGQGEPGNGWQPPAEPGQPARGRRRYHGGEEPIEAPRSPVPYPDPPQPRFGGRASVPVQPTQPGQPLSPPPPARGQVYGAGGRYQAHGSPKYGATQYGSAPTYRGTQYGGGGFQGGIQAPERPAPTRTAAPARPANKGAMTVLGVLAIVALVGVLIFGGYIAFAGNSGSTTPTPPKGHDIGSQQTDATPLTVAELFPAGSVNPAGTAASAAKPYPVVKSQASADCKTAVVGNLADVLSTAGCTQVVRATLTSPDNTYVLTAGMFNLRDDASAKQAADGVQASVKANQGRLTGFAAGGTSDVIGRAPTRLGWDVQGHFLIYCVVARADGAQIADDATTKPIINDLVEKYLKGVVLKARAARPASSGR